MKAHIASFLLSVFRFPTVNLPHTEKAFHIGLTHVQTGLAPQKQEVETLLDGEFSS